jgi:methylamine dehydrogenase accessory protein MauD
VEGWWAASYAVLWLLVVMLCVVVVALARQIGALHLRLGPRGALEVDAEGPPLGAAMSPIEVTDLQGRGLTIGGAADPRLLLFVSPDCGLCAQVLPALDATRRHSDFTPLVVTDADPGEVGWAAQATTATTVSSVDVVRSYDIPGTPYVVILDENGVVTAKGTVNSLEQLEGLVTTAERRRADRREAEVG